MTIPPPLALGAAILFWGVRTDNLVPAVFGALGIEAARWLRWRWDLTDADFYRLADLASVAFAALAVYQFSTRSVHGIYAILSMLPYVLMPLVIAQYYSRAGRVPLAALIANLRRRERADPRLAPRAIDLGYPCAFAAIISACTGERSLDYFLGTAALLAWLVWPMRPRRYPIPAWIGLFALATGIGFAVQTGMRMVQNLAEEIVFDWLGDAPWTAVDPNRAATAIGEIGRLKFSDRIRIRVQSPDAPLTARLLLREAAYDTFRYGSWRTDRGAFTAIDALPGQRAWPLARRTGETLRLLITVPQREERGVVGVPYGAQQLSAAQGLEVQRNEYGTITLEHPPGQVRYEIAHDPAARATQPPAASDLELPDAYREEFNAIVGELGLRGRPPAAVVAGIERFFAENFRYTLVQRGYYPRMPLTDFLRRRRSGHCEYFGTATALLLRAAAVPARYAVGYSVHEWSALEQRYVARARHAHAWAEAWIDGAWVVVDTTPAVWADLEEAAVDWRQPLTDLWSWLGFQASRLGGADSVLQRYYGWIIAALLLVLGYRLTRRGRTRAVTAATARRATGPGSDSEFNAVVGYLDSHGLALRAGEPLGEWLARIETLHSGRFAAGPLRALLALHYRYRFDPKGLTAADRAELQRAATAWLRGARSNPAGRR
jgi:transglutaminase-like putative cysteine protease